MEGGRYQTLDPREIHADEIPNEIHEGDVMFHVETNKTRWNHIDDLDSFFSRVYYYHQKHGFLCIFLQECFELLQFIFIVGFATFLMNWVDYAVLFRNDVKVITANHTKVTIGDVILPITVDSFGFVMWVSLLVAFLFWLIRVVRMARNTVLNLEIRSFYHSALNIQEYELDNLTWYDVQKRLRDVQRDQQMCIHKAELTELDIYHRILRFKNYMVAMVNKNLLPLKYNFPIAGEVVFISHGLKYNIEMLLFWGPWAPFENNWHLKEDFKKVSKRKELAAALANRIFWVALANLLLSPLIFLWQILHSFFSYAEHVKREPGALGLRQWSRYAKVYIRHFNELEHELHGRLVRAYRPAAKYMSIFNSPLMTVIAQNVAFVAGAIFAVLTALTIWDEDVIQVEHVLLLITALGSAIAICRGFIPDEHLVWCPEKLLTTVLAHVHYFPDHWKGQAHNTKTREEFAQLFQYRFVYLVEELLSPLVVPIILLFYLRPKSLEIVDFFRNFTVEVVGVGDVCSFAQMDVRKHGNPTWQLADADMDGSEMDHSAAPLNNNNTYAQAEDGKTELSLVHFTHMNPEWRPPPDSGNFIAHLKERAGRDATNLPTVLEENALYSSLNSVSSLGNEASHLVTNFMLGKSLMHLSVPPAFQSVIRVGGTNGENGDPMANRSPPPPGAHSQASGPPHSHISYRGSLSKHEGPLFSTQRGIVSSGIQHHTNTLPSSNNISFANSYAMYPSVAPSSAFRSPPASEIGAGNLEASSLNMCVDALYMHELHRQGVRRRGSRGSSDVINMGYSAYHQPSTGPTNPFQQTTQQFQSLIPNVFSFGGATGQNQSEAEKTPLLKDPHHNPIT